MIERCGENEYRGGVTLALIDGSIKKNSVESVRESSVFHTPTFVRKARKKKKRSLAETEGALLLLYCISRWHEI